MNLVFTATFSRRQTRLTTAFFQSVTGQSFGARKVSDGPIGMTGGHEHQIELPCASKRTWLTTAFFRSPERQWRANLSFGAIRNDRWPWTPDRITVRIKTDPIDPSLW